jgi:hypothetical protein
MFELLEKKLGEMMGVENDESVNEAAILVLGHISCPGKGIEHMKDFIPNLIQYLIPKIKSQDFIMRQTSIWSLSMFTPWMIEQYKD